MSVIAINSWHTFYSVIVCALFVVGWWKENNDTQ